VELTSEIAEAVCIALVKPTLALVKATLADIAGPPVITASAAPGSESEQEKSDDPEFPGFCSGHCSPQEVYGLTRG